MTAFTHGPNGRIAYERREGKGPGVLFLTGFKSDMQGAKAQALAVHCRERGHAFTRFDYTGHGASEGAFENGSIGAWLADALHVLDTLTAGRQIVVGSSMGGWLALLLALKRPERVAALIGIAAAPDFTERLIWQPATEAQKCDIMEKGVYFAPSCYGNEPYPITRKLIEEGRAHLLLDAPIPIHCPVRLLHGAEDPDVPWKLAAHLLERLETTDARLTLLKGGDHRLSSAEQLKVLMDMVEEAAR